MARNKTFAQIVAEVEQQPPPPLDVSSDGVLVAPDGKIFERINDRLDTAKANELIAGGATIAIDSCGCSGYCAVDWTEPRSIKAVPATRKKGLANLEEWRTQDGTSMVLISGDGFKNPTR